MRSGPIREELVLLGGGHAHVHVLKSFGMKPMAGVRVTVIARDIETPYSGMLPGMVAGHYAHDDCHVDLAALARFAGARLLHDEAIGIDRAGRRVHCRNRPPVRYDVLSIDIGSSPRAHDVPGARELATPVKPIDRFAERWERILDRVRAARGRLRFVTVGGGAGGVELTLAMQHRLAGLLRELGRDPRSLSFALVTAGDLLASHNRLVQAKFRRIFEERGIAAVTGAEVAAVEPGEIRCGDGRSIGFDEALWVTQAGAAGWLAETGLALDRDGFIQVDAALRSAGDERIFAAGDIAANLAHPRPKAGVFAVRQGPPLAENLRRALRGRAPLPFRPQREFLSLISTGDRYAVASRGAWAVEGAALWRLKDWIDRRWMARYRELPDMAGLDVPGPAAEEGPMRCGGCGAKVPAPVLTRVLERLAPAGSAAVPLGLQAPDDAAVIEPPPGRTLLQTVDFFRAFVDDPYVFGRIAACHALGDIYAMGGEPLAALAIATVPHAAEAVVEEDLFHMLRGGLDVLQEAGAVLAGGHSGEGAELALGFAVTGTAPAGRLTRKAGLRPGDRLVLTKPLGTGVLFAAAMQGKARGRWLAAALSRMQQPAAAAARCLQAHAVTACTDVTGFGLLGHMTEMLRASGMDARIDPARLPVLPGALDLLDSGFESSLQEGNARARSFVDAATQAQGGARYALLFDPQTAGGLLAGVPEAVAAACVAALRALGYAEADIIGEVEGPATGEPRVRFGEVTAPASTDPPGGPDAMPGSMPSAAACPRSQPAP